MPILLFIGCAIFGFAALACFRAAWRGTAAARRALATKTTRIADLDEGRVEVAGVIALLGDPVVAPSGKRCAAVKVTMTARTAGSPKSRRTASDVRMLRAAPRVVLRDDTGTVELDLENVEVVAPVYSADGPCHEIASPGTWLMTVPSDSQYVAIEESAIEDGARVVVYGQAKALGEELEAAQVDEAGYRGAAPKTHRKYRIEGLPYDRVVVNQGSEGALLFRAAWPVALLCLAGSFFLAHAAAMALILSW